MNRTRNQSVLSSSTRSSDSDIAMYVLTTEAEDNEEFFADQPLTNREIELHQEAFVRMESAGISPQWISPAECLSLQFRGRNVFVLPAFRGSVFQHLNDLKCKLYGPPIVLQYLDKSTHLPRWSHPVFSETMRGAVVCFTGIDRNERTERARCIQWMSGAFTTDLNVRTTHLISLECDPKSEKYQKAAEHRLPVLSTAWVDAAWAAAKENSEVSFVSTEQIEKYGLKLFDRLVMTVSGTSKEERVEISRLIEAHGGRFTGEMRSGVCTHLICDSTTGEKYRKARAWGNMSIVTKAWLIDCVERGYRLAEQRYEPSRKIPLPSSKSNPIERRVSRSAVNETAEAADARSSTPQPDAQSMPDPDFSAIPPYTAGLGMSQMTDATMAESTTTALASPTPVRPRSGPSRPSSGRAAGKRILDASVAALDLFDTSTAIIGDCLEGCRILVVGFTGSRLDKIRKIINAVGATRMNKFDPLVTHVVVGSENLDRPTSAALKEFSGAIVTAEWLVESYKKRRPQPPSAFAHPLWSRRSDIPEEDSRRSIEGNSTARETIERDTRIGENGQQRTYRDFTEIDEQALADAADAYEARAAIVAPAPTTTAVAAAVAPAVAETTMETEDEQNRFFANYTFRLTNFNEEVAEEICNRIIELGGTIEPDSSVVVNMLVCPLLDYEAVPMIATDLKCEQIVTIAWLQICDELGQFIDPDSNPVFRPIPADPNSDLLKGCVVTITGFLGVERSVYIEIARILGASFQETLSRNARGDLKATTHLIVRSTESEKYKRAVLWGLPVVDAGWLLACMLNNRLEPCEPFAFKSDSVPLGSFGVRTDDHWRLSDAKNVPVISSSLPANQSIRSTHSTPCAAPVQMEQANNSPAMNLRCRRSVTATDNGRMASTSTPVHARIESLRSGRKRNTPGGTPNGEPLIDTPSKFLDPEKPFKPAYNLKRARVFVEEMDSPQSNNSSFGFASISQVGRVLEQAAKRMGQGINYGDVPTPKSASEPIDQFGFGRESSTERPKRTTGSTSLPPNDSMNEEDRRSPAETKENEKVDSNRPQRLRSNSGKKTGEDSDARAILANRIAAAIENDKRSSILPRTVSDEIADAVATKSRSRSGSKPPSPLVNRSTSKRSLADQRAPSPKRRLESVIGWVDNANEQLRQEGMMRAADESSQGLDVALRSSISFAVADQPTENPLVDMRPRTPPIFLFTAVDDKDKPKMIKIVKDLGGVMLDSKDFDVSCTHLIAGSTFRNEKLLGSIASGKWVLQRSYLDASLKQGQFVNEDDYEWGNEKNPVSFKDERTAKLAAACKRWRLRLAEHGGVGAYDGWRCILFVSSNKMAGMRRLLQSGGGQAFTKDEITSYENITHALIDNCSAWRPSELDALIAAGVRCYRSDYIATYLMEEPLDERASYWPEYRASMDLMMK